jgi:DNA polymerase-3 subunit epsilon
MREIIFDTETTGVNPAGGDRMVEIGCIEMINRCETGRTFHAYFNPERPMPAEAEAVHGLSSRFLSDKPVFAHSVDALLEFIGDAPLIAHNAAFDFGFLNAELALCARDPVCMSRMICTLMMARKAHPGAKHSLDALCSRYGVDRSARVRHGALLDAQLLTQVYIELTGGRQIGLTLMAEPVTPPPAGAMAAVPTLRSGRTPRFASVTQSESEAHARFVAALTDPLWHRIGVGVGSA